MDIEVVKDPDYTMERLVRVAKELRQVYRFNGYIHLKSIPGASRELVNEAGLYADRMSVNIEIPNERNLRMLAPEKNFRSVSLTDISARHRWGPSPEPDRQLFSTPKAATESVSWKRLWQ